MEKTKKLLYALLCCAMLLALMCITAVAAEAPYGVKAESVVAGDLTVTVDDDGVLTWTDLPDVTSYDLHISMADGLVKSEEKITYTSYDLEAILDGYKRDSGGVQVSINVWGGSGRGGTATFLYSSPYPKLEAPTSLYWGGNGMIADWNDVPRADGYTLYLYQSSGGGYNHWTTTESRFDFSEVNVSTLADGWYFAVQATSTENYRNSEFNESRRRGDVAGSGLITGSITGGKGFITVDEDGVLTWSEVPNATSYDVNVWVNGSLFRSLEGITTRRYELEADLNAYKKDSGDVMISLNPNGPETSEYADTFYIKYSSPYRKLEAPDELSWNGMTALWDEVPGADGYTIYLYHPSGTGYDHWTTTNTSFDFSGEANPSDGWYFTVQATSDGDCRNSVFNESPRKSVYGSSQTFDIGAYAHNTTLDVEGGGEVYLETSDGDFDWSSRGYTEEVQAGTYVTVKAKPADGYEFVEWRQGTGGDTISTEDVYSFYCAGNQYLYAIFRKVGTIFPEGAGETAGNPAVCYSYAEFKYAMENPNIRYVALVNVNEVIPGIEGEALVPAISVNGIKNLNVLGDAVFTAPANDSYKTIVALLHTTQGDTLTVGGSGSLKFRAVASSSYNAVIYNQGGSVIIDGGTLIGSHNTAVYGKAIWQDYGELRIFDGELFAENALAPGKLPVPATAVYISGGEASISGGTFKTENMINTIDLPYGLDIGQNATVELSGGTFHGVVLPKSYNMDDYVQGGCVMTIDSVKADPANYSTINGIVEVYREISKVDIHVNSPVAGEDIPYYIGNVYFVPEGCTVKRVSWLEDGEDADSSQFVAGKSYTVEIALTTDDGVKFANPLTSATINGKTASVKPQNIGAENGIILTLEFGACPVTVPQVDLTVTAPKEGEYPSYTIGCGSDAYYPVGINSDYTKYRQWYESSDGDVWWKIDTSSKFTADYYYKLVVDIRTNNGYEFPVYDNGISIVPGVSATVNGYYADVIKAPEQDPSRYITVEYNFGECSDSVVNSIIVENVTAPVAGERPTYTYSIRGSGYQMNTAKNAYEDIYWKNPPEQWYFIKNGIGWYDLTKNDWVYEHETFIPGHEYQVRVYLKTEDGYEFAHNQWYEPTVTATVNGNTAVPITTGSDCTWYQQVQYTFTCAQQEVSTVLIYLDAPVAGQTPDVTPTTAYPNLYLADSTYAFGGVCWYDDEGIMLDEDDVFERGRRYKVDIKLIPAKVGDANVSKFVSPAKAYINGEEVTERFDWDAVYVSKDPNTMYVYYTFFKSAPAPEIDTTPKAFLTQPKGGEVFVGEALNVSWETTFVPTQTEIQYWDGEDWDQWDVQEPENKRDDYDFENVDAETIRFRIAAYMGNEIVATSKEFTVTWESPEYATAQWNGNTCTVTLEVFEDGVSVMVASYESGKLVKVEYLTVEDPTAIFTGDNVKVFFLDDETYAPIRKMMELQR